MGTAAEPGFYWVLRLSPDDRRLAVAQLKEEPSHWNWDIQVIELARAGNATRLTFDAARDHDPAWSPDGTQIAFVSNRNGERFSLFRRASNGSGSDEPLMKSDTDITGPDWSRDGRFLLYTDGPSRDLWTLPLSGDGKAERFVATPFLEDHGKFSPDGRWIAYTSNASGRNEVYVRQFPAGKGFSKISRDGGRNPQWRDDGRELFFLTLDGRLMAAGIETAKGLQPTVPQPLFHTGYVALQNFGYAPAKDGQRFLISVTDPPGPAPISVVMNWPATLRK